MRRRLIDEAMVEVEAQYEAQPKGDDQADGQENMEKSKREKLSG